MSGSQSGSGTSGSGVAVALAWALVGIPLLWGVAMTVSNALKLFQ